MKKKFRVSIFDPPEYQKLGFLPSEVPKIDPLRVSKIEPYVSIAIYMGFGAVTETRTRYQTPQTNQNQSTANLLANFPLIPGDPKNEFKP